VNNKKKHKQPEILLIVSHRLSLAVYDCNGRGFTGSTTDPQAQNSAPYGCFGPQDMPACEHTATANRNSNSYDVHIQVTQI